MRAEFVNPILAACKSIVQILLFEELRLGELVLIRQHVLRESISFVFWMTGDFSGRFIFSMNRPTALRVAGTMIGEDVDHLDDMSKSAIGEMASMILGRSSIMYSDRGFDVRISPPTIVEGESMTISPLNGTGGKILKVPLLLRNGDVMELRLEQQGSD